MVKDDLFKHQTVAIFVAHSHVFLIFSVQNSDFHSYSIKKNIDIFKSALCYLFLHVDKLRLYNQKIGKFGFHKNGAGIGKNAYQVRYGSLQFLLNM